MKGRTTTRSSSSRSLASRVPGGPDGAHDLEGRVDGLALVVVDARRLELHVEALHELAVHGRDAGGAGVGVALERLAAKHPRREIEAAGGGGRGESDYYVSTWPGFAMRLISFIAEQRTDSAAAVTASV